MTAAIYQDLYNAARNGQTWIDTADIAKIIRLILADAFPGVKFSVRIDRYSGGSSIDIRWTDGPTEKAVDSQVGYLEGKGFDGSIDMSYYHTHWITPAGIAYNHTTGTQGSRGSVPASYSSPPDPEAIEIHMSGCYIFTRRTYSPETTKQILDDYNREWGKQITPEQWNRGSVDYNTSHWISQAFKAWAAI